APEESSVVLRRGLAALGLRGGATVLGSAERLPAPHAALANGAAAHALEMDDTHQGGSIHLGATVLPAALAAAELGGASGERVLRAALAQAGFSGPATILEGRFGFLHAYSDGATTAPLAAREGYELMRTSVKPHACCRYMQGPIDAVLALRAAHRIEPDQVERVEVGMLAAGFPIVCEPAEAKCRPASVVEAQFSLPFGVAVALARG